MGGENRTKVNVSLSVTNIMDINEQAGVFQVQFHLIMSWLDSNLFFKNLKNETARNTLLTSEQKNIWTPEIIFVNTENKPRTVTDDKTSFTAEKRGDWFLVAGKYSERVLWFNGYENPITMRRFYNQRFLCSYEMMMYPF